MQSVGISLPAAAFEHNLWQAVKQEAFAVVLLVLLQAAVVFHLLVQHYQTLLALLFYPAQFVPSLFAEPSSLPIFHAYAVLLASSFHLLPT